MTNFDKYYYNLQNPAAFTGSSRLLAKYTKENTTEAKKWLLNQDAFTLHKGRKRKFPRRKVFVVGADHLWQLDLMDLSAIASFNDDNNFVLICIDCFSRYAFATLARNKSALVVKDAFSSIISKNLRRPVNVQTDKGKEFVNAIFQQFLKENYINFYTSENSEIKCALVERLIRTIKEKMWRMFTYNKNYRYVEKLDDIIRSYNNTYHSTIKMAPTEVSPHNEKKIFNDQYSLKKLKEKIKKKKKNIGDKKNKFSIGDIVRLSRVTEIFEKGYYPRWTKEVFTIYAVYPTLPITFGVKDYKGEKVKGKFYAEELQKVYKKDIDVFEVEKVLKTRKRRGKKQYFVRWLGYSAKHDSWVDEII